MHVCGFGLWTKVCGITITMTLTDRVTTRCERDSFFIVHCHSRKGHTHVMCCFERIRVPVHPFWVHVDQPHHYCGKWIF